MSAAQNLKDNWPTLAVAVLGSIVLPLLVVRFTYATAQEKTLEEKFEKKVDKVEYYKKWESHDVEKAQQWQTIILMLEDLKKQNSEIRDDIRELRK